MMLLDHRSQGSGGFAFEAVYFFAVLFCAILLCSKSSHREGALATLELQKATTLD